MVALFRAVTLIVLSGICLVAVPSTAAPILEQNPSPLIALQQQDVRLARIADRLLVANAELCRQTMPITGIIIHSRDQYGADAAANAFANAAVAIEKVVPGSPAALAGLLPGDGLLAIGGTPLGDLKPVGNAPVRDAVFDILAAQPADAPLSLLVERDGHESTVTVQPEAGCRALVEVLSQDKRIAQSDGRVIQVSYGMATHVRDEDLAVIFAHELGHLVLEHRRRLSEAGVSKGFFGELGGNRRRNRQAEVEADLISVHLLANAGYDPELAPHFWLSPEGRSVDAGILRSAIYPSPTQRAEFMQQEIDSYLPADRKPTAADHLLDRRDQPF